MIGTWDVEFAVRVRPGPGGVEVVPRIGGRLLTDLIDAYERGHGMQPAGGLYGGLVPASYRFGAMDRHFRGGGTTVFGAGATPVLGCSCGEWGCWPLQCRITVVDDLVVWDDFVQPFRPARDYGGFGPFAFDRGEYEDALADLALALA